MNNTANGHRRLTQKQYANYAGLDPSYVSKLVNTGIIRLDEYGLIDPIVADKARGLRIRPRMPYPRESPQDPWARICEQIDALVGAIDAQLKCSLNMTFVARLDEQMLRESMADVVHELLKRWQKAGGPPGQACTPGARAPEG